ncbi:MAG: hypothetical protein KBS97_02545 [Firmicutes bacterium]|nr:hypothetical protein [Candidatus Fiminaster equi]
MEEEKKTEQAEQSKDTSKKKKILKYVLNGVIWGVILGFLIYSGLKVIDVKSGYKLLPNHSAVIVSDSMSYVNEANYSYLDKDNTKPIKKNDVIHTSNFKDFGDVKVYEDVAIYLAKDGTLICHRVIDKYEDNGIKYIVTRGDANNSTDAPVNFELVRGRVTSVTGGGGAVLFFQSPYFVLALCGTGFFILLGYLIFNLKTEKKAAGVEGELAVVEEKPIEEPKEEPVAVKKPVEEKQAEEPVAEPTPEEPEPVEEKPVEQPKVEDTPEPAKKNGRFIPKGGGQKRINWPPKNTRWTKENNPTANKKRAEGGDK